MSKIFRFKLRFKLYINKNNVIIKIIYRDGKMPAQLKKPDFKKIIIDIIIQLKNVIILYCIREINVTIKKSNKLFI